MVLTDVLFSLLFLMALSALFRGLKSGHWGWFVCGGLATGLCWLTKYHGFFPLLIMGVWMAGRTGWDYFRGTNSKGHRVPWRAFALSTGLAILLYLPWALFVAFTSGYAQILNNTMTHSIGSGQIIITPPGVLLYYFSSWLTPGLLITSLIGVGYCLFKTNHFALFLLFVIGGMMMASMLYFSFPRLALPVIPMLCLLSAAGVHRFSVLWQKPSPMVYAVMGVGLVCWNLFAAWPTLNLATNAYEKADTFMRSLPCAQIIQLNKNYYFYEASPSIEMRTHNIVFLDRWVRSSDCVIFAIDPIIRRLPECKARFEEKRGQCELLYEIDIEMYETNYYQGIDPRREELPISISPFKPKASTIRVYRMKGGGGA
jgi:hypothetical protein